MTDILLTEEQRAQAPCFVARCRTCGNLLACAVDAPEYAADNSKSVASWIKDGLDVGKLITAEVRTANWCKCPRAKRKAEK